MKSTMLNATPDTRPTKLSPKPAGVLDAYPKRPARLLVLHGPTPRQARPTHHPGYGQGMTLNSPHPATT